MDNSLRTLANSLENLGKNHENIKRQNQLIQVCMEKNSMGQHLGVPLPVSDDSRLSLSRPQKRNERVRCRGLWPLQELEDWEVMSHRNYLRGNDQLSIIITVGWHN